MAEYIDREELLKHYIALVKMDWNNKVSPPSWSYAYESFIDYIAELPTADVVPKSEVEWLYQQVDCLSQEVMYNDDIAKMKVDEAKAEVAREIFADIDRVVEKYSMGDIEYPAFVDIIAELKKKYTEEKK